MTAPPSPPGPDDGTHWLAGVFAEMMRTGLALVVKRYPDLASKRRCSNCGHRS